MELYFLGTGAGAPSKVRNVTSIALNLSEERGTFWLFDCGEGTQHQMLRSPFRFSRLEKIFITHLHGDHLYGLPGLLTSRSFKEGHDQLTVYGPRGMKRFVETVLETSHAELSYELTLQEIEEGLVFQDERFSVHAARLDHRIESIGYRIVEKDRPGKLNDQKLKELGIPPGPVYARLKRGEKVEMEDGTVLDGNDFIGPQIPGRIVTILGDTRVCATSRRLAENADVLVHEATFSEERADLAEKYFHSTAAQAAQTALECGVKNLILTHISSRYHYEEGERKLLEEARTVFPNTHLAHDFWAFPVMRRKASP